MSPEDCPHKNTERESATLVCTDCGTVLIESDIFSEPLDNQDLGLLGLQNNEWLSRTIVGEDGVVAGSTTILRGVKMSDRMGVKLTGYEVANEIKKICHLLGIDSLANRIKQFFDEYTAKRTAWKGAEMSLVIGAATFIAIRENDLIVTLNEVARSLNIEPGDLATICRKMKHYVSLRPGVEISTIDIECLISRSIEKMWNFYVKHIPLYTSESELNHLREDVTVFPPEIMQRHLNISSRDVSLNLIQDNPDNNNNNTTIPWSEILALYRKVLVCTSYCLLGYAYNAGLVTGRQPVPIAAAIVLLAIEATEKPSQSERNNNHKHAEEFVAWIFEIKPERVMNTRYREIRSLMYSKTEEIPWAILARENYTYTPLYINDVIQFFPPVDPTLESNRTVLIPSIDRSEQLKNRRIKKIQTAKELIEKEKGGTILTTDMFDEVVPQNELAIQITDDRELIVLKKLLLSKYKPEEELLDAPISLLETWLRQYERPPITRDLDSIYLTEDDLPSDEARMYLRSKKERKKIKDSRKLDFSLEDLGDEEIDPTDDDTGENIVNIAEILDADSDKDNDDDGDESNDSTSDSTDSIVNHTGYTKKSNEIKKKRRRTRHHNWQDKIYQDEVPLDQQRHSKRSKPYALKERKKSKNKSVKSTATASKTQRKTTTSGSNKDFNSKQNTSKETNNSTQNPTILRNIDEINFDEYAYI